MATMKEVSLLEMIGRSAAKVAAGAGVAGGGAVGAVSARCQFGGVVSAKPPVFMNDTHLVCQSTYGAEGEVDVSLALNGQQFTSTYAVHALSLARPSRLPLDFPAHPSDLCSAL